MRLPPFEGEQRVRAVAADYKDPTRLFATNGAQVLRSLDGGCSWREVLAGAPYRVLSIVVPGGDKRVYVLTAPATIPDDADALGDAPVLVSDDDGASWRRGRWSTADGVAGDLPFAGGPRGLAVSRVDSTTAFLLTRDHLFSTTDAGRTWTAISGPVPPNPLDDRSHPFSGRAPDARQVEVDPVDRDTVWLLSQDRLFRSTDAGRTWETPTTLLRSVDFFEVSPATGSSSVVYAFDGFTASSSSDGGDTWEIIESRYSASTASAFHNSGRVAIVVHDSSSTSRVLVRAAREWVTVKAPGPVLDVLAEGGRAVSPLLYATTTEVEPALGHPGALYAFSPPPGIALEDLLSGWVIDPPPLPPNATEHERCPIDTEVSAGKPLDMPSLAPRETRIVLAPGESRKIPYNLTLSGASAADLYFLIDASGSMKPYLCGVAQDTADIADTLIDGGVDAWFGVGTYQHLSSSHGDSGGCHSYFRWTDISPMNDEFFVPSKDCGGVEPQMSALVQSARGDGQSGIQPGLQANFREHAIPIIVHISDEAQSIGPAHATLDEAVDALDSKDIRQVGFYPVSDERGANRTMPNGEVTGAPAREWLTEIARRTGALSVGPVDCDGDDDIDIQSGEPLVCAHTPQEGGVVALADAVSNMVLALADEAPARLVETTRSGVVEAIGPRVYDRVNLRVEQALDFKVTYTCSFDQAGQTFPVRLAARVGGRSVAMAEATVVCSSLSPAVPPPPLVIAVPPIAVTVAPVPGPAPAPVSAPAPGSAPAPAPAPHANPAAVPQRQDQTQIVTVAVEQKVTEQIALENSMVRLRDRHTPVEAINFTVIAGGLSLMGMFGYAAALRARARAALERSRPEQQ